MCSVIKSRIFSKRPPSSALRRKRRFYCGLIGVGVWNCAESKSGRAGAALRFAKVRCIIIGMCVQYHVIHSHDM